MDSGTRDHQVAGADRTENAFTGDRKFVEEMLPFLRQCMAWLHQMDDDGDMLPSGYGIIEIRGLKIDKTARRVYIDGVEQNFTTKEFDLLTFLAENPNHVFSKEELFRKIWNMESVGDIATVTVHIKKIREKVEFDTSKPQYIETIWGVGYRFKI